MSAVAARSHLSIADAVRQMANRLPAKRIEAIECLGRAGEEALEHLSLLKGAVNDGEQTVRLAAAHAICGLGEITMPAMARMLSHPDKYVRRKAVWGLGRLGGRAVPVLPDLCQALKDADARMATGAAQTIGAMGAVAAAAVPELAAAMRGTNVVLCRIAAKALSQIGPPALPQLLADLKHHDVFVRGEAAMAIGWMGPDAAAAVPGLIALLSLPSNHPADAMDDSIPPSTEDAARAAAAAALGKLGDVAISAVGLLEKTQLDRCPAVRQASEQSLRMMGAKS